MLQWQAGQLEYAVAALAIWMTTDVGQYVCSKLAIWKIPLHDWDKAVKNYATECRRLGQIFGTGKEEVELAFGMRRLVSLAGRTPDDADWEKEMRERTQVTTAKRGFKDGKISSAAYRYIRWNTLDDIVAAAMPALAKRSGSFQEYLDRRWWSTPRGTTSFGASVKAMLKELDNPDLDLQLRPIKPVVQEVRSMQEQLRDVAAGARAHARGSTKPEPGLKKRALLAVDDITALVAGYASNNIETVVKSDGMVLRQDPADVSEWVNFDVGDDVWRVSNDYSNFNILNSLRSLQLVDIMLAKHWLQLPYRFAKQKAAASHWVAASYNKATMQCPLGTFQTVAGLWSGHRNTARDNTILHTVYLRAISSVMRALFTATPYHVSKQRICGDDETLGYSHWHVAVCHTLVADALGYTSQVSKGMLSLAHDEFLQLIRIPGRPPKYPVANTILTFCSGNWYKDPVRNLGTTVKDISDHLWDMHLGGVPLQVCQQLGMQVLDYLMQVKDTNGELIPLEWWKYRGCGLPEGHPLWGCVITPAAPDLHVNPIIRNVPAHATDDAIKSEEAIWDVIGREAQERVRAERIEQSYRNVAKNQLTREYDRAVCATWPRRENHAYHEEPDRIPPVQANRWRAIPTRALERSARTVAIKVRFPPELLGQEEMWKALPSLAPRDRAQLIQGLHDRQKPTRSWYWRLPPLLRVA